ncbi:MAG: 4-(cytidine 5'-diphospho)-2-C-methyl-D-erythritol kinase [Streptosporangiaceae bacterium]
MTHVTQVGGPEGSVTARVPAKVNLQLSVGPLREDGYHDVVTVFHAVSLFDELTVTQAPRTSVTVSGEGGPAVPLGPANLAVRAAVALARATGRRGKGAGGVRIEIRKRIPVAAGLAGGSADAAAALVACNELWGTGLSTYDLGEVGARIGSDVPFSITGGTAIGLGRGERLTTALVSGNYHWVLAFGATGLSTPDVYAACDRLRAARRSKDGKPRVVPDPDLNTDLMAALRSGDPAAVGPQLSNDLQPAALSLQPLLRQALQAGKEHGALGAIVSGSGPTCAFLAKNADAARELAVGVTGAGVCRAVVQVSGPAPGASVVESGALA